MTDALLGFIPWMMVGKVLLMMLAIYCLAHAAGHALAWAIDLDDVPGMGDDRAPVDN